jgi:hypothetical protein
MTGEDLERFGYTRALWLFGDPRMWLRPDGLSVCTEGEALAEIDDARAETEQ